MKKLFGVSLFFSLVFLCYAEFPLTVTTRAAYDDPPTVVPGHYDTAAIWVPEHTVPGAHHDAETTTLSIPGEKPSDINNPDPDTLRKINEALRSLPTTDESAISAPGSVNQSVLEAAKNGEIRIDGELVTQKEVYSSVFGDPVRVTTGSYVMGGEKDISWMNGTLPVEITRSYTGGSDLIGSLGQGWVSSLDSRIYMGSKFGIESLYSTVDSVWDDLQDIIDASGGLITSKSLVALSSEIGNDIGALTVAKTKLDTYSYSACQTMASEAGNKIATLTEYKKKIDYIISLNSTANTSQTTIKSMYDEIVRDLSFARDNLKKNSFIDSTVSPNTRWQMGNETLTYIDPQGTVALYDINTEPDFESNIRYPDGSINRYPAGSDTTPRLQSSYTIRLNADGSYTVTGNGGVITQYSYYGQPVLVTGRNGECLKFSYKDHVLEQITDDYGRNIAIEYKEKKISSIKSPAGNVLFGYTGGRLSSVVDYDLDRVEYEYNVDGYLAKIVKSDRSSVRIRYHETNGERLLVTSTVHEELPDDATGETFEYDLTNRITTYVNHSGEKTVTWYDVNNRTVMEQLPDKTVMRYQYDSSTGKVSEESLYESLTAIVPINTTKYEYKDARNRTKASYSDGSYEECEWNEFDQNTKFRDRDGRLTEFVYDPHGNLCAVYKTWNAVRTQSYWADYNLASGKLAHDRIGEQATWTYDWDTNTGYLQSRSAVIGGKTVTESWSFDITGRILSFTDGENRKTTYSYNPKTSNALRNTVVNDPAGLRTTMYFDSRKDLVKIIEEDTVTHETHQTVIEYDKRHLPISIVDGAGKKKAFEYRKDGKLVVETSGEWSTVYGYDHDTGELSSVRHRLKTGLNGQGDPEYTESVISFSSTRDASGRLSRSVVSPNPNQAAGEAPTVTNEYSYDIWNRVTSVTDPYLRKSERRFSPAGRVSAEQSSSGGWIGYQYDETGLVSNAGKVPGGNFNSITHAVSVLHNADGSIKQKIDRNGLITKYEYDGRGLLRREFTLAGEKTYEYDQAGRVTKESVKTLTASASGQPITFTTWSYNDAAREVTVSEGGLYVTLWKLDAWGNPVKKTDSKGNSVSWSYYGSGKLKTITDENEAMTEYFWNDIGKISRVNRPDKSYEEYQYDETGNLILILDNLGIKWSGTYNRAGLLESEAGRPGIEKSYAYDRVGRLLSVKTGGIVTESYSYDDTTHRITFRSGDDAEYSYIKNEYGELVSEKNRLSDTGVYGYDFEGRPISVQGFSGSLTETVIDDAALVTTKKRNGAVISVITKDFSGRVISATSASGTVKYLYDAGGRLVAQTDEKAGELTSWTYDSNGRRKAMSSGNRFVKYDYGKAGELLQVTDNLRRLSVSFEYDALGRERFRRYGNGVTQATGRDAIGRVTLIRETAASGELLRAEGYVYDNKGRRSFTITESGALTRYEYDAQSRLASVWYPYTEVLADVSKKEAERAGIAIPANAGRGTVVSLSQAEFSVLKVLMESMGPFQSNQLRYTVQQWKETYTYDSRGNRATKTTPWGTIKYTYDSEDRLLGAGTITYTYDKDGNLLSETGLLKTAVYTYNGFDRMETSVITDLENTQRTTTRYGYDAFGRRNLVQEAGGDIMRTLYDGLSFEIIRESVTFDDGSFASNLGGGRSMATGSAVTTGRYAWIDDSMTTAGRTTGEESGYRTITARFTGEKTPLYARGQSVATLLAPTSVSRGGAAYFGTDALFSVRSSSNEYGTTESRYEYDAFGSPYAGDFDSGIGYGYTGKAYDPVTGLYDYGFRDYSPSVARFTTPDPIRDGNNWFAYVNNDPVNFTDPYGLFDMATMPEIKAVLDARPQPTNTRVSQNAIRPEKPQGPCLFRSLQATAEEKTGKNLSLSQIKAAGEALHNSGDIGSDDEFYSVNDPTAVVKDALTRLGYPDAKVTIGNTGESTGDADYTIRFVASKGHFQLGNSEGDLLWEPYAYNNSANAFTGKASSLRDVSIDLKGK